MTPSKLVRLLSLARLPTGRGAASAGDAASRLAAIRARVLDPGSTFSVRAVLAELAEIEPLTAPDSVERGRVMQLRSFVEDKGKRAEDAIRHGRDALRIEALHPFLDPSAAMSLHHAIARRAEAAGRCGDAVPHYRAALPLMAQVGVSRTGVLGTRQRLAFCLHEVGQFAEARAINEAVLAEAAALFPPDDPRTFRGRLNLAQNEHALGDTAAAWTTLERLLADVLEAQDAGMTDQILFQLGVLAFEGGRPADASELMGRRLSLARASGDQQRITAAADALSELNHRISEAGGLRAGSGLTGG